MELLVPPRIVLQCTKMRKEFLRRANLKCSDNGERRPTSPRQKSRKNQQRQCSSTGRIATDLAIVTTLGWLLKRLNWSGAERVGHCMPYRRSEPHSVRDTGRGERSVLFPLSSIFWAVGPIRPSLVRGLRPRNAPSTTTCLADLVSTLVTRAQSKVFSQTTSRQSHQIQVGAGLVPALEPSPTDGRHRTAGPGACTASRQKTMNNSSHRWHRFPARLFPPQIWNATSNFELFDIRPLIGSNSAGLFDT